MGAAIREEVHFRTSDNKLFSDKSAAEDHQERLDIRAFLSKDQWWRAIDIPDLEDLDDFPNFVGRFIVAFPEVFRRIRENLLLGDGVDLAGEDLKRREEGALTLALRLNESAARIERLGVLLSEKDRTIEDLRNDLWSLRGGEEDPRG